MRMTRLNKIGILVVLMVAAFQIGCGDPDANIVANPGSPVTPPTITSMTPPAGSAGVCPNNTIITATFSKPMNAATINTSTFTVTSAGGAVAGTVTYVAATQIATFTPSANLAFSTLYTATITTGAKDTFGNGLAANFTWTFTTAATLCPPPPAIIPGVSPLATACNFGILGATPVVSSIGPTIVSGGDIGFWPAASITGFPPGTLTGVKHQGDAVAQQAQSDLTVAYNNAAGAAGGAILPAD